jgi:hypothetical protein
VLIPALIAEAAFLAAALAWHAVAGHHAHYKLIRLFRPGLIAPPAHHDAGWHALPWYKRAAANGAILLAALFSGLAWTLSPVATLAAASTFVFIVVIYGLLRVLRRAASRLSGAPVSSRIERSKS